MDLRKELLDRVRAGESMTALCREYGISRKTGNKFKARFAQQGLAGLADGSHAPLSIPHKTPTSVVKAILVERVRHPTWGPKKLKVVLEQQLGRPVPSASTISDILLREGLRVPKPKHRSRHRAQPTRLRRAGEPNDVWCIDYKGQFRLGDRTYCYPLTLTDQVSRYLLACEAMSAISDSAAREVCVDVFRRHGLPAAIRSDNGAPFASTGLAGLTRLSAYWLRLGIRLERIRPAHPEENGRHERMHRTLKFDTAKPPRHNLLQQQQRFDAFVAEFNHERPHEALAMQCPATLFRQSPRPLPVVLPDLTYPGYDDTLLVSPSGVIRLARTQIYVTTALAGMTVGVDERRDGRWLVSFMHLNLGYIDLSKRKVLPS